MTRLYTMAFIAMVVGLASVLGYMLLWALSLAAGSELGR